MWTFVHLVSMDFCPLFRDNLPSYEIDMSINFRNAFLDALEASGLSVAEVARRSGVSKDQLNKLKQRETAKTNVDDARKVAEVFGKTLDDFIEGSITSEDIELADILAQLEPSERQFLLNAAKAQIAARDSE